MSKPHKALKMAIEALELINEHAFRCGIAQDAIEMCKEALVEQKSEWRGLSDEEINNLAYQSRNDIIKGVFQGYTTQEQYFGRLLEAKLKEKNHEQTN